MPALPLVKTTALPTSSFSAVCNSRIMFAARLSPVLEPLMSVAFTQLVQSYWTCWCNARMQLHYSSFLRLQPGLDQCAAFVAVEMAADVVQRARLRKLSRAAVIIADTFALIAWLGEQSSALGLCLQAALLDTLALTAGQQQCESHDR